MTEAYRDAYNCDAMKKTALLFVLIAGILLCLSLAQDEFAELKFLVIRDYNGKPIRNASVVLHPVKKDGKQSRGGLQLKADAEGKASFDGVPYGKLRVQVLAPGFQTFGEDYEIDQPVEEITVRMKRPQQQFSIYEDKPEARKDEAPPQTPPDKSSSEKPQ